MRDKNDYTNNKMDAYDEDISENKFYRTLLNKHKHLYDRAAETRWMICIPRSGVFSRLSLTITDYENHILRPSTLGKETLYLTASGKTVHFIGDYIQTSSGFKDERKVKVLFEETYFNSRDESFKVFCLDRLLEGGTDVVEDPITTNLENYEDCAEYLWGNKVSKSCEKQVNDLLHNFYPTQHSTNLRHIIDETNTIFTKAMRTALRDPGLRKTVKQDKAYLDLLKVAMETYVMHSVYKKVFKVLSSLFANDDAALNKTTRNLSELQVKHLGIRSEFTMNVPRARRELTNMNQCKTPLEKLHCLRRTIMGLSQPNMKTKPTPSESSAVLSSDDLLPLLVFLVVKSEVPNWLTNLAYLHNFRFSSIHNDEFGFYLASVEAAVEHVRSGDMNGLPIGPASSTSLSIFSMSPTNMVSIWPRNDSYDGDDPPSIELLFEEIRHGRLEKVEKLLNIGSTDYGHVVEEMCHPLCGCDRCEKLITNKRNDPKAVTAFSRDDRGCTALHVAASYGHSSIMETLMKKGGIVCATDYHGSTPLHLACQKGQQAATLLLLHHGADINADDNDGNTPLHLCSANGHEECVKAILYSEQVINSVEVNFPNCRGNTPLHEAARWGYENIVEILLEHGASVEARNRRKETPLMRSLNANVNNLLQRAVDMLRDGQEYMMMMTSPDGRQTAGSETKSLTTPLMRRQGGIKISPQQRAREVEKLLRASADGDVQMVRYQLGWESDSDDSDMEDVTPNLQLCHPLCQCQKCSALQKRTTYGVGDITVNTSNAEGFTSLHVSALHGHETLVALLLRRGANPNVRNTSYQQVTPLHLACKENKTKVVQLLLDHGAKCNTKDVGGNSPLHYCAMSGHLQPSTILIQTGANCKQANARGNLPLHEAARNNYVELVELLSNKSPSTVLCRNKAQLTPIQLSQNFEVSKILKKVNESYQEQQVLSQVAVRPTTLAPGSPVKKVSMHQLFQAYNEADLRQHEALKHSLEIFNKRKQLKQTKSFDRSAPILDVTLKHQLSIKHFDRRRLRHIELEESVLHLVAEEEEPIDIVDKNKCDDKNRKLDESSSDETTLEGRNLELSGTKSASKLKDDSSDSKNINNSSSFESNSEETNSQSNVCSTQLDTSVIKDITGFNDTNISSTESKFKEIDSKSNISTTQLDKSQLDTSVIKDITGFNDTNISCTESKCKEIDSQLNISTTQLDKSQLDTSVMKHLFGFDDTNISSSESKFEFKKTNSESTDSQSDTIQDTTGSDLYNVSETDVISEDVFAINEDEQISLNDSNNSDNFKMLEDEKSEFLADKRTDDGIKNGNIVEENHVMENSEDVLQKVEDEEKKKENDERKIKEEEDDIKGEEKEVRECEEKVDKRKDEENEEVTGKEPKEMVDLSGSIPSDSSTFTQTHSRGHSNVSVEDMVTLTLDMRDNYFRVESDEDAIEEKRNWDRDRPSLVSSKLLNTNTEQAIEHLDSPLTDSDVDNLVES
ncbi:ankyrin repeat domain-containing protein 27-like [Antedon mediterranea]|uniref:ankyrin repeat domain-containing protein 27-like n=1 Tax=Antedon mediterranea TaxID=105859 RepID=UPI003AF9E493